MSRKWYKLYTCSNCGAPLSYDEERCPLCNTEQGNLKNVPQQNTQETDTIEFIKPVLYSQVNAPETNSHKTTTENSINGSNLSSEKSKCHFVFLSHSSEDRDTIQKVYNMLSQSPYSPWMAPQDIVPGKPYAKSIIEGKKECSIFIIFVSSSSMNSDNVLSEVEIAHKQRKIILPIFIEDVKLNDELEYYLARKQWIKTIGKIEDYYTIIIDSIKENLN